MGLLNDFYSRTSYTNGLTNSELELMKLVDLLAVALAFSERGQPPLASVEVKRILVGRLAHLLQCIGSDQQPVLDLSEQNIANYKAAAWTGQLMTVTLSGLTGLQYAYSVLTAAEGVPIGSVTVERAIDAVNAVTSLPTSNGNTSTTNTVQTTSVATVTPAPTTVNTTAVSTGGNTSALDYAKSLLSEE